MGDVNETQSSLSYSSSSTDTEALELTTNSNIRSEDLHIIPFKQWANDAHLKLTVLNASQNFTYEMLLREFSLAGVLAERAETWKKLISVDQIRDKIDSALFEIEVISDLCAYLKQVDCEKVRLDLQYERLRNENTCLCEQQQILKERLQKVNENLREAEAERNMQYFIYKIRHTELAAAQTKPRFIKYDLDEDGCISGLMSSKMQGIYHLALKYITEGHLDVAVAMCTQLLREQGKTNELTAIEHGVVNFLLGIILSQKGRLKESLTNMEDALKTLEISVGKDHPSLCCVLVKLAEGNLESKNYKDAEKYLRRAIVMKQIQLGEEHEEVIKLQMELCTILVNSERSKEAIQLGQSIRSAISSRCQPGDPVVIKLNVLLVKAHLIDQEVSVAHNLLKTALKESFPNIGEQSICDILECSEPNKRIDQTELYTMYEQLEGVHGRELLIILRDIYKIEGNQEAYTQLACLLNNARP
ncbi:Kinesin light chain [Paragonimus heterotremus]|uniref:Kinesin light chain n=1 Tax=Paragonimus heterotremus TaxID=100268 RepID=A0A8J4WCX8_9TREM|nr:Kinesin light chain [Paragonimus heterotremus]